MVGGHILVPVGGSVVGANTRIAGEDGVSAGSVFGTGRGVDIGARAGSCVGVKEKNEKKKLKFMMI